MYMLNIPPLYLFGASRASTFLSLYLSLFRLQALLARNSRNGETRGNLVKSLVILSWDFLVSNLTHPKKELHIAILFGAPVNVVGYNFGFAPAGLGFCRRGAPERRKGTKRYGRPCHVCIGVIRVIDAKYYPTLSIRSFMGIDLSLSLVYMHNWPETPAKEKHEGIL